MVALNKLNLNIPFKLIHPNLTSIEVVTDLNYLNYQTTLGIREQSLLNCIIEDLPNNQYYKVVEIIVLENKNPWWVFEFFNPMLKVNLNLEKVEDQTTLQKLNKLSKISNTKILEGRF